MPAHVSERYLKNPTGSKLEYTDEYKDVTILFADIKGFTDYSSRNPPETVVKMLSALFTDFDKLCLNFELFKLYTIGDCYVSMSCRDARERNPEKEAMNTVLFAFGLIQIIQKTKKAISYDGLDMRIGIHTVDFFPGVVADDV
jgi:phospholipid-translocating ATPase